MGRLRAGPPGGGGSTITVEDESGSDSGNGWERISDPNHTTGTDDTTADTNSDPVVESTDGADAGNGWERVSSPNYTAGSDGRLDDPKKPGDSGPRVPEVLATNPDVSKPVDVTPSTDDSEKVFGHDTGDSDETFHATSGKGPSVEDAQRADSGSVAGLSDTGKAVAAGVALLGAAAVFGGGS